MKNQSLVTACFARCPSNQTNFYFVPFFWLKLLKPQMGNSLDKTTAECLLSFLNLSDSKKTQSIQLPYNTFLSAQFYSWSPSKFHFLQLFPSPLVFTLVALQVKWHFYLDQFLLMKHKSFFLHFVGIYELICQNVICITIQLCQLHFL